MHLDEASGRYSPSYFNIRIATYHDLHPLENLHPDDISTYFHEYFHFIQDLTTPFGLSSAWNTYDRTIRLIKYVQDGKKEIELPLNDNTELQELERNHIFYLSILSAKVPTETISDEFYITKIELSKKIIVEDLIPDEVNKYVRFDLKDNNDIEAHFWFGALAVMETMTYIIQGKFFDTLQTPTFPYKSGLILANEISKRIGKNTEFVFALCDVSLFSPYPGRTFYEILLEIEKYEMDFKKAEDIYDFGFEHIKQKWGLWDKFEKYKESLVQIITQLYGHQAFSNEREWLLHIIDEGYKKRRENPLFMLQLYREKTPFSIPLFELYQRLGSPETINIENKRWFSAPLALKDKEDKIHTVFLLGFEQIQNLLLYGRKDCVIINHCEGSKQAMPIDKNCITSPWLKAKEDPLCPFAALWKSFGLDEKSIKFS